MPHRERTPNGNIIAFIETSRLYLGLAAVPTTRLSIPPPSAPPAAQGSAPPSSPLGQSLRAISRSLLLATGIGTAFGAAFAETNRSIEYNQKKLASRPGSMASQHLEKADLKPKSR